VEAGVEESQSNRTTRRDVVKAGALVAGGVAAMYVKPTLTRIQIPTALAASGGPTPSPSPAAQGCTLGYWKNHTDKWQVYSTTQLVSNVFTVPACVGGPTGTIGSATLLGALSFGGGSGTIGGAQILLMQAVAALLNAVANIGYPIAQSAVLAQTNAALASCNRDTMTNLAATFQSDNSLEGPYC
jgi:hypothetical protein